MAFRPISPSLHTLRSLHRRYVTLHALRQWALARAAFLDCHVRARVEIEQAVRSAWGVSMDETLAYVVALALVALVICALVMRRRLGRGKISLGPLTGEIAETQGPTVKDARATGTKNTITAEGRSASVENTRVKGNENTIGAKSG
jgi:hypothetical protein